MRGAWMGAIFGVLLSLPAWAGEAEDIRGVIRAQVDAFLADDVQTAFGFASPTIRTIFGTPENFGRMVANGYPMIWRPRAVDFLDLRDADGRRFQRVRVQDGAGEAFLFDYEMVAVDGEWRINGVYPVQMPAPSV